MQCSVQSAVPLLMVMFVIVMELAVFSLDLVAKV